MSITETLTPTTEDLVKSNGHLEIPLTDPLSNAPSEENPEERGKWFMDFANNTILGFELYKNAKANPDPILGFYGNLRDKSRVVLNGGDGEIYCIYNHNLPDRNTFRMTKILKRGNQLIGEEDVRLQVVTTNRTPDLTEMTYSVTPYANHRLRGSLNVEDFFRGFLGIKRNR